MHSSPYRLVAAAVTASLLIAVCGFAWEIARFGRSDAAAAARLERVVRERFAARAAQVQAVADRVARNGALVADASGDRERLPALFQRLLDLTPSTDTDMVSATVYVVAGGQPRVLAWSDGPAEDVASDWLNGPATLFLAPGTLGLRLVVVEPIEDGGRRVGVAAAETVLSAPARDAGTSVYRLMTPIGAVTLTPRYAGAGEGPARPNTFLISNAHGAPLLEVGFAPEALAASRQAFRQRVLGATAAPLIVALLLLTGRVVSRRRASKGLAAYGGWSLVAGGMVVAGGYALSRLAALMGGSAAVSDMVSGLTAVGLVTVLLGSWWWRRSARKQPHKAPAQFALEQLLAGVLLAGVLWLIARVLEGHITASTLDEWRFPLFPMDGTGLMDLAGLLLVQLALGWTAALLLAAIATRWRVSWRRPVRGAGVVVLWLAPAVVLFAMPRFAGPWLRAGLIATGVAAAIFALLAATIQRYYRRTTEAMRLTLGFLALLAPALALYPVAGFYADSTARTLIEQEYAPETAGHLQQLVSELVGVESEIDRIPRSQLLGLVTAGGAGETAVPKYAAFSVWTRTSLARTRVTSSLELFGADRTLVSRFALNVPERSTTQTARWRGSTCAWEIFGEAVKFGAQEWNMLHAERGLCDPGGHLLGAVVVHAVPDYQALPFVASANPYYDVLQAADLPTRGSRLGDLQVVVYGWSFHPRFASGPVAWPISPALIDRLYHSREPFWVTLDVDSRTYHVYFSNDRAGIYALGYPAPSLFEHLTRLSESAALTAILFVIALLGAVVYTPFIDQRRTALATLLEEIRTSFYRKLFLFFVLAAVGPVVMLALAFGTYMTRQFQADVQKEAENVVVVARRVLEELVAGQQQPLTTLSDDAMVWTGQVLNQDVNLFEGSTLAATSQRDLFDSGLLPKRTPAAVYRAIVLNRLPTYVDEDQLGTFRYLVAAVPVPLLSPDEVLTVPLALRQREIAREIDELNRGVLVGAVFVVLFAAGLGASVAHRVSDPVARLTRATRQIAAGALDVRIVADTADELRRLVDDFNSMATTLGAQRAELARTNQLKAWAEMARQVAHEIKNPLTPIQLAAEHLQRVHEDRGRPLAPAFDQCVTTILRQVRLLRQIAGEFSNFAGQPEPRPAAAEPRALVEEVVRPYQSGLADHLRIVTDVPATLRAVFVDRTLVARALTNIVENAIQAMPEGGTLRVAGREGRQTVTLEFTDTGVGMDAAALARAFEPYFSTKTAGSGLGLANAKRNIELCGGTIAIASEVGRGTTVTVELPVAGSPGAPARA